MHKLRCYPPVLILMLVLSNFLFYGTVGAQCPEDPCPQQNMSGEIEGNPDMAIKWAAGHPPGNFDSNGQAILKVINGTGKYIWEVDESDDATFPNGQKVDETVDRTNTVTIGGSADCSVQVTVTNKGDTVEPANISQVSENFEFDYNSTGLGSVARNSSKKIYVSGGIAPFTWSVSTPGFYFDSDRTTTEITTDSRAATIYTDGSACGTANIDVSDDCGMHTEGIMRSSAGKWNNYVLVDETKGGDVGCGGCDNCFFSTGHTSNLCKNKAPYSYKVVYCRPYSSSGCKSPSCDGSPQPACNNKKQACRLTVSDGICSYTKNSTRCTGICWIKLSRKEWICN